MAFNYRASRCENCYDLEHDDPVWTRLAGDQPFLLSARLIAVTRLYLSIGCRSIANCSPIAFKKFRTVRNRGIRGNENAR